MKLSDHPRLDALCGEYLLGTLRGRARRRFERALRSEPRVQTRLRHWQDTLLPRYSEMIAIEPSRAAWKRLRRELQLSRYGAPWHRKLGLWRAWAVAATLAFVATVATQALLPLLPGDPPVEIARLESADKREVLTASLSARHDVLLLHAARPVIAGREQSYELWLLPAEGGAPVSLAVLGELDARVALVAGQGARLRAGARLAVSVEPAGGSPTGAPTGPVILVGEIRG